jgi:ribosomal protein L29
MEKPQKLRELSDEELKQKERELKRQLFNVRFRWPRRSRCWWRR